MTLFNTKISSLKKQTSQRSGSDENQYERFSDFIPGKQLVKNGEGHLDFIDLKKMHINEGIEILCSLETID